jgi:small multidrug resistance pump
MQYLYLSIAILAEVIATSTLKAADGFSKPIPSAIVVVGYGTAFYLLSIVVKTLPVGIVYAIWSGAGVVLVATVGVVWWKQHLDLAAVVGIGLILTGVVVLEVFSKTVPH